MSQPLAHGNRSTRPSTRGRILHARPAPGDRPTPAIGYHRRPAVPLHARNSPRPPPSRGPAGPRPRRHAAALLLLAVSACYDGDFFGRLVDPDATAAFRITQLTLVDPHTYSGDMVLCQDSTATYNQLFAENIGSFDINTTLVLHPLDPSRDSASPRALAVRPGDTERFALGQTVPISVRFDEAMADATVDPARIEDLRRQQMATLDVQSRYRTVALRQVVGKLDGPDRATFIRNWMDGRR